jgi:hypothetical protein
MKVYQKMARLVDWNPTGSYIISKNEQMEDLVKNYLPSGSGFDGDISIDEKSTDKKIILHVEYHHMNDNGFYDGWSTFKLIIVPSLAYDYSLVVKGETVVKKYFYDGVFKNYIIDTFMPYLDKEMED